MAFLDWFKGASLPDSWHQMGQKEEIDSIIEASYTAWVAIFKHSTRCGISHSVLHHLIDSLEDQESPIQFYYLDLIQYRDISNTVSARLGVAHQSPQLILLKDGEVQYHASHHAIQLPKVLQKINV